MSVRAAVLGCGMVGATMVRDLSAGPDFDVTGVDVSETNLRKLADLPRVKMECADLSDTNELRTLVRRFDILLGALPSRLGFQSLRTIIEAGKPYCDITFMSEDAMDLDSLARQNGVTAVVDCGVSPGLSNLCIGHAHARLDRTDRAAIYVGGLPKARYWPFQYKAPFAPGDVIEEYTRPARLRVNGVTVVRPALSEPEIIDFPGIGTLEAFNTDGLRSLLTTIDIPNMLEKTLRYPGHRELMGAFREAGLFDTQEIEVGGCRVRPRDLLARLLFPKWTYEPGDEEFTILRVDVEGAEHDRGVRYIFDLYDEYDAAARTSSMARTTAFPCTIMARLVAKGQFTDKGVVPLELAARQEGLFDTMSRELARRGVTLNQRVEPI